MPDPTTEPKAAHTLTLQNLSAKILSDLLQSTGWTRGVSDIVIAGGIIARGAIPDRVPDSIYKVPDSAKPDEKTLTEKDLKVWGDATFVLELTEKEREVCKFVIDHFAKNGKIPPTRYAYKLLLEFKLDT